MKLVLAAATMGAAQAFVTPSAFSGSSVTASRVAATSTPRMSLADYKEELAQTANAIAGPGEPRIGASRHSVVADIRLACCVFFRWLCVVLTFVPEA